MGVQIESKVTWSGGLLLGMDNAKEHIKWLVRIVRRPRGGSNSQPLDSKSITLSIELRGRDGNYTRI